MVISKLSCFRIRRRGDLMKAAEVKPGFVNYQKYMVAQLNQYRQYITHCLASLNKAGNNKRVHFATHHAPVITVDDNSQKVKKIRSRSRMWSSTLPPNCMTRCECAALCGTEHLPHVPTPPDQAHSISTTSY